MIVRYMKTLYAYIHWANERILSTAVRLSADQFTAQVGASFPSVRDTLVHTLSSQNVWLHRFQKQPAPDRLEPADFADVTAVHARWQEVEARTQTFVAGLSEDALGEVIHMTDRSGRVWSYTLWQMMAHQANHAMQHRSEVAVMLTQFGHSPGDLDFLDYIDLINREE